MIFLYNNVDVTGVRCINIRQKKALTKAFISMFVFLYT